METSLLLAKQGHLAIEADESRKLFNLIYDHKILPAGRHLWATGIRAGKEWINNCFVSGFEKDPSIHFTRLFDLLMQGGGVGANYSDRYLDICDPIHPVGRRDLQRLQIICRDDHPDIHEFKEHLIHPWSTVYTVDDSREGWVGAVDAVFEHHRRGKVLPLQIDVSNVRSRGSIIHGFGGIACGPGPLVEMLIALNNRLNEIGEYMTGMDAMSIDHAIARCVVSGGVRRSSRMAIKSWLDPDIFDFILCKITSLNHWTTNISVEIDDEFFIALDDKDHLLHDLAEGVLRVAVTSMLKNGEPGFFNISLARINDENIIATNPCGEIALENAGVCNLGHVNLAAFDSLADQLEAFRLVTRFLIRATFAPAARDDVQEVIERTRRIGVGFFGYQEWVLSHGIKYSESAGHPYVMNALRLFKEAVDTEATSYAAMLGIPTPIKTTCVAPTGTIVNLPGKTSGLQTLYARHFKRRVRYQDNDIEYQRLALTHETEDDLSDPSGHTKIIVNYCEDPLVAKYGDMVEAADEVPLESYLAIQAMVQRLYADNAISMTINIRPEQYDLETTMAALIKYLPKLKGTTIFPELSRAQMPFERISREAYENATIREVSTSEMECSTGSCPIK